MATNRVRTMPTSELVQRVVVALVDVMQSECQTDADLRLASRLYRELAKRTDSGLAHGERCTCEDCCYDLDEPFRLSEPI